MNMVATYCKAQREDECGEFHISYNELDSMVGTVQSAGLCRTQPLILLTWRDDMVGGEFGSLVGGPTTVLDIYDHSKKAGWPKFLFTVLDEPGFAPDRIACIKEIMPDYEAARRRGLRTVVAQVHIEELGDLYDVWIQKQDGDLPAALEAAEQHKAEVWMYDCVFTGRNPLYERFYAGLWMWKTGVKGNMVWSYGWYVRIDDSGLPESRVAWEQRLNGVNDYRYLHTLEVGIRRATAAGKKSDPVVVAAQAFLEGLRTCVPHDSLKWLPEYGDEPLFPGNLFSREIPAVADYDRIRDECAQRISEVQALLK